MKNSIKKLGPLRIGDVLSNMMIHMEMINYWNPRIQDLLELWGPLGISKSLQEIIDEEGWIEESVDDWEFSNHTERRYIKVKKLKSPSAQALIEFVDEVITI